MLGKTLDGKYQIGRLLGSGGMGSVYAAEDVRTGHVVAVKIIHASLTGGNALVQRFEREARAAGSIDTDHIARCFDAGTDPQTGSPYMVLEYLVGEDLHQALKRLGPLPPDVALRILAQTCLGVSKAHEAHVVHRDLKPANIFLAQGEGGARTVKVLDFGVAKIRHDSGDVAESSSGGLTRTGSILGSPLYMSPEQARSVKNIDHRSDIWSLGVVLYQSVAGRTPYDHISGLGDLIIALCSDLPPPVQQFAPWVTPEVAHVIDHALRIDPGERFQTAGEMFAAICELLPDGFELRDEMLVALDDDTHDHIAPSYFRRPITMPLARRMMPSDAFVGTMTSPMTPISASGGTPEPPPSRSPQSTQTSVATTGTGLPDTGNHALTPPARRASTIAIALACVAAGGAAVYAFTRPTVAPAAPTAAAGASASLPVAPAAAPPLDTSAASTARATLPAPVASPPALPIANPPAPNADAAASKPAPLPHARSTSASTPTSAPATGSKGPTPPDYSTFGGRK